MMNGEVKLQKMYDGVSEQDVLNALGSMCPWAYSVMDRFLPAYLHEVQTKTNELQKSVQVEVQRRRACEAELQRCIKELERAKAEIRDLQMRDLTCKCVRANVYVQMCSKQRAPVSHNNLSRYK